METEFKRPLHSPDGGCDFLKRLQVALRRYYIAEVIAKRPNSHVPPTN